ncbi:hypothetical protein OEZ85_008625 [Tetradesmus obliquus]|uniref:AAA+ ATPase domain-containing protein n=1 Tax=Tetradesmus obliquus TaxID=3088 RepID=A0ABY8TJQ5_TETOB|nr:hypothetical protein OEZ85_008625 [Tetradesmus obliquus]
MEDTTGCEQMVNEDETTASQEQRLLSDLTLKRHNSTFVCAGASGAGKTTLINAISKELGNDRWGAPKANSVTRNVNTLRTNKSAVRSITSWLTQMKGINTPIEDMQPLEFVQLVADYVLVARQQNGEEYKRDALIGHVNSILRHFNTVNTDRHLADITCEPYKKLALLDLLGMIVWSALFVCTMGVRGVVGSPGTIRRYPG